MEPFILSIDAGTTGITVVILDKRASICKKYYSEFTQYYPNPGWVEHDGDPETDYYTQSFSCWAIDIDVDDLTYMTKTSKGNPRKKAA